MPVDCLRVCSYLANPPMTPTIGAHQVLVFLAQVVTLLVLARLLGGLSTRLGMPSVVGELTAGILLGPTILGALAPAASAWLLPPIPEQAHLLDGLGQIAVLLLVGVTGLAMDLGVLRRRGGVALKVSLGGLLIPLAAGAVAGYLLPASLRGPAGDQTTFALFVGVAMCVSAIPVIAKTLSDLGLLHRDVGQLTLAAGMFDDAVGWMLLSMVTVVATVGLHGAALLVNVALLVGFLLFAWFVARPVMGLVLRRVVRSAEPGSLIAAVTSIILLGAVTTHLLGMEPVFGAFLAGLLVRTRLPADELGKLTSLRTFVLWVLAPIFLASQGLQINLLVLAEPMVLLCALAMLAVAVFGKFLGAYIGARAGGLSSWEGIALGAGMNARGVVQIVVATVGLRLELLTTTMYTVIVFVAIGTSLMAPPLLKLAMRRVEQTAQEQLREAEFRQTWSDQQPHAVRTFDH